MAQLFHRSANLWTKLAVLVVILVVLGIAAGGGIFYRSAFVSRVEVPVVQPVPFSHRHHVAGDGIDCRYCHTSVEESSFAGIPPTETCMTCHSQIWTNAPMLEPVRASFANNVPLQWNRVHRLPDFVYFNHSIHVQKGIGCASCHGAVDEMPITWQAESLRMRWCLNCHGHPEQFIRPRSEIFNLHWQPTNQQVIGPALVKQNHVQVGELQNCSICHR